MDLTSSIKTIMSTDLKTATPKDPVRVLDEIFKEFRIHHVPVVDENQEVVGVVSKSDFLYLLRGFTDNKVDTYIRAAKLNAFKVGEIMADEVVTIQEDASIKEAVNILSENHFRSLPIVGSNKKLVGIVTPNDILRYIGQQ